MSLLAQIEGAHVRALRPTGGCHNCPRKRVDFVPATLVQGPVLFIGDVPGATEAATAEAFVGSAGKLLRAALELAGVPGPWSFTNAAHCRTPGNRPPNAKEVQCCLREFVLDEVEDYSYVVLLGNTPVQAFFPGARAAHFRGNFAHHPDYPGKRFYASWHPGYILRNPHLEDRFARHMERLARVLRGEPPQPWSILRGDEALDALREMVRSPLLSADIETNSLHSWVPGGKTRSFCATADGKVVAALYEDDPQWQEGLCLLDEFLADPSKGVVGSNVSFDTEWRERHGGKRARLTGVHDVAIIWYEAAQYQRSSLKMLVAEELDGYRHLLHQPHEAKDVDLLLQYNAEDVVYSLRLFLKGMAKLSPRTRDLVTRVLGPMSLVYQRARTHGIYVREEHRLEILRGYEDERQEAVMTWRQEDPDFIPGEHESGKGLMHYLFQLKQLPVLGTTEKGDNVPSTDKNYVKAWVRGGATYLRHLLKIREVDKLVGTFIGPLEKHMDTSGRIHPSFWLTSTDTSRPSSSDPNVYNIPRNRAIRGMYGAPPGGVFVESDLSQIEFRVMVCLAQDATGIEAYQRGDDAHTATARVISGNPNPTKEQRTNAKPVNFGNLYGAHWRTAQSQALNDYGVEWSDYDAQKFQEAFFDTYKSMRAFHASSKKRLIANRGWFESATGHVFYYRDWDHPKESVRDHTFRSALNAEAQGPASNICHLIAVVTDRLLHERGLGHNKIVNSVYDSVQLEVPDPSEVAAVFGVIEEAAAVAHEWVKDWFVVPLVIEHEVGDSWGSLETWVPSQ